jgi:hypothetical protein
MQEKHEEQKEQHRLTSEQLELVRAERKTLRQDITNLQATVAVTTQKLTAVTSEAETARQDLVRLDRDLADMRVLVRYPGCNNKCTLLLSFLSRISLYFEIFKLLCYLILKLSGSVGVVVWGNLPAGTRFARIVAFNGRGRYPAPG